MFITLKRKFIISISICLFLCVFLSRCAGQKEQEVREFDKDGKLSIYTLEDMPKEEQLAFGTIMEGNYSQIRGAREKNFSFVNLAEDLWRAHYCFMDMDEDEDEEFVLLGKSNMGKFCYILKYEDGEPFIWKEISAETNPGEDFWVMNNGTLFFTTPDGGQYQEKWNAEKGELERYPVSTKELKNFKKKLEKYWVPRQDQWRSVQETLSDDFKVYVQNFSMDNLIGSREDLLYWSNPLDKYEIWKCDSEGEKLGFAVRGYAARSIYAEEDQIYFTNRADYCRLYRITQQKEAECLSDYSVEKLLKINGRFYFLSGFVKGSVLPDEAREMRFLYSMDLDGKDVRMLCVSPCLEYESDGIYLYGTFQEEGKEIRKKLDLQGQIIEEGDVTEPVMAERGDVYMTRNGFLTDSQKRLFMNRMDVPGCDWGSYTVKWLNRSAPEAIEKANLFREDGVAQKEGSVFSYQIRVPQFNYKVKKNAEINEYFQERLAEWAVLFDTIAAEKEAQGQEPESVEIGYQCCMIDDRFVSVYFYDEKTGKNCESFLTPVTFNAETGERVSLQDLFRVSHAEYMKEIANALQCMEDFRWSMEELVAYYEDDFYLTPEGLVVCYRPGSIEKNSEQWQQFFFPYKEIYEFFPPQLTERYEVTSPAERVSSLEELETIGEELAFEYFKRYCDVAFLGFGRLPNTCLYFERPVILEESKAGQKINAILAQEEEEYFYYVKKEQALLQYTLVGVYGGYYKYDAEVTYNKNNIFSVTEQCSWNAGASIDYRETFNFYIDTGERIYLSDLLSEDEETIREMICQALEKEGRDVRYFNREKEITDYDFTVSEEGITVYFDESKWLWQVTIPYKPDK